MTTTQINGMGFQTMAGSRTAGASKEKSDDSFAAMMSASISGQTGTTAVNQTAAAEAAAKPVEEAATSRQEEAPDVEEMNKQAPQKAEDISKENAEAAKTVEETEKSVNELQEGEKLPEELAKKIAEVLQQIQDLTKDILKLDESELNAIMEQLGVTMVDLLNPQILQQIVVEAAGGKDFSILLTNESVAMDLQQLLTGVQDILADAGLNQAELVEMLQNTDFAQALEQAMTSMLAEENSELAIEEVAFGISETTEASETSREAAVGKENVMSEEPTEANFRFEVVREGASADEQGAAGGDTSEQSFQMFAGQAEQFMNQLSQAVEGTFMEQMTPAEMVREIANQLLERIRVTIQPSQTSMELTLNPESLGRVNLNIVSKQGVMTAQFTTQTEAARIAIESQMTVLRENLQNQGLKVEAIEVSVSDFAFQQGDLNNTDTSGQHQEQERKSARRSLTLEEASSFNEVTEAESIALDMMERNGNQVDFIA